MSDKDPLVVDVYALRRLGCSIEPHPPIPRTDFVTSGHLKQEEWREVAGSMHLSLREAQIASLILANIGNAQIASVLGISTHTVHSHLDRMYRKLRIRSREELITRIFLQFVGRR